MTVLRHVWDWSQSIKTEGSLCRFYQAEQDRYAGSRYAGSPPIGTPEEPFASAHCLQRRQLLSVPGEVDLEVPHKGRTYRTRRDGMVGVGLRAAERRAFALKTSFSGWNGRIRSCGCSYAN